MQEKMLSILIVDDARFSTTVVDRALTHAGYHDLRIARSGQEALLLIEQRPADIIVSDWLMPEMDGLEMTKRVRQQDEAVNRYTYIILLTAKEGVLALQQAFDEGVDDFVHKAALMEEMLPRVMAAERLIHRQNRLLQENLRLIKANSQLRKYTSLDPLTGLELQAAFLNRLDGALRQCKKRGGRCALILLKISNLPDIKQQYKANLAQHIILAFSRRLTQLVRPMDVLGRLDENTFAMVTYQEGNFRLTSTSFQRLFDSLNQKAFKTAAGFIRLNVSVSMSENDGRTCDAKEMLMQTHRALKNNGKNREVTEVKLEPPAQAL